MYFLFELLTGHDVYIFYLGRTGEGNIDYFFIFSRSLYYFSVRFYKSYSYTVRLNRIVFFIIFYTFLRAGKITSIL